MDAVNHLDERGSSIFDDEHEEENEEAFDIFGGFRGGESLEKNDENLFEVGGESFSWQMLNHRLKEIKSFMIIIFGGYQFLKHSQQTLNNKISI